MKAESTAKARSITKLLRLKAKIKHFFKLAQRLFSKLSMSPFSLMADYAYI